MATAAIPTRSVSEKFTRVPNSFIQNQHLFKLPASRALALIVFRAEQDSTWHGRITDAHWQSWTGLGERAKELACKELQGFGMETSGRGDKAKYSWNWDRWNDAISTKHQGEYDPKRAEREKRAVTAKDGAKVHEECRDHGCAMLREGGCPAGTVTPDKPSTRLFLTTITQPVAQTVEQVTEKAWDATMAALCSFFPLIGVLFLSRLLSLARAVFPDVTDTELAEAVRLSRISNQATELFWVSRTGSERLICAITLIRRRGDQGPQWSVDGALKRCAAAVKKRGLPEVAEQVEALIGKGEQLDVESSLAEIESGTLRTMVRQLTDGERETIRERAAQDLACMGWTEEKNRRPRDIEDQMKAQLYRSQAQQFLKLPRISLMDY